MLKIKTTVDTSLTTVADLANVKASLAAVKSDLSKDGQFYLKTAFEKFDILAHWGMEPISFDLQGFSGSDRFTECWNVRVDFTAYDLTRFYKGYFYASVRRDEDSNDLIWDWDTSRSTYDGRQYFQVRVFTQTEVKEG